MIKTILFATDLGIYSSYLLQHVFALAEKYDAKIEVVHAVEPLGVFADALLETYVPKEIFEDLRSYGMTAVMDAIREQVIDVFNDEFIESDLDIRRISDINVVRGHPADVILHRAKEVHADLIMLGSHSPHSHQEQVLGSTVSKILQLAKMPVYMIPISTSHQAVVQQKRAS